MTNKDLFKQAIAEAKTIREAAITNAKEALEESLTPHLKEMLAQKLQEMEEDEMNETDNNGTDSQVDSQATDMDHGNVVNEAEEDEEEPAEEEAPEGEEEEEMEIEDMTIDDLKDLIRDIVAQEAGQEDLDHEEMPADDMTGSEEEEIDINELLAELDGIDEGSGYGKPSTVPGKGTHSYSLKPGAESGDTMGANDGYTKGVKEGELDESIDVIAQLIDMFPFLTNSTAQLLLGAFGAAGLTTLGVIIAKVQEMALKGTFGEKAKAFVIELQKNAKIAGQVTQQREGTEEEMEEGLGSAIKGGLDKFDKWIGSTSDKMAAAGKDSKFIQGIEKGVDKAQDAAKKAGITGGGWNKGNHLEEESEELNEALNAVKELRTQLQEVNLLNAKLLYVNKVFKANNLSEGQKVNVIAAFDKAETVREVKLVFETVSKNVVAKKPTTMKEHTSFASKATGITAAPQKEVINEVSEQVRRMQKLAGIIK